MFESLEESVILAAIIVFYLKKNSFISLYLYPGFVLCKETSFSSLGVHNKKERNHNI